MHGILGFTLPKMASLSSVFKMNEDRLRVNCLYFVGFLDLFGVSIFLPLLTHRARELGASPSVVGAIGSVYGGLQFFSSPLMGKLSDEFGRKSILLLSLFMTAIGYFLVGLPTTLVLLALSRVPTGIFKHSQSISKTYLADITLSVQHPKVFGNFNAFSSLGFSIGPLIGGYLAMQSDGFFKVTTLAGEVFLINAVFVWLFVEPVESIKAHDLRAREEREETDTDTDEARLVDEVVHTKNIPVSKQTFENECKNQSPQGTDAAAKTASSAVSDILKIASISSVLDLILIRFLMGFSMLMFRSNFTTMLEFNYGTSPRTNGYILSYNGLVSGFCGTLVGPLSKFYSHNDARMLLHFSVIMALSIVGVTFSPNILIVAVFIMPLSLSSAVARVCVTNLLFRRGCQNEKGVLLGVGNSMLSFARMISPALGGVAMETSLYGPGIIGASVAGVGILIMVLYPQDRPGIGKNGSKTC